MVEYTESAGRQVTVKRAVEAGENVVPAGAEARRGDVMVNRGTRVRHAVVAVAAAVGRPEVAVYRRPTVAVLATGDELVDINLPPGPNEIRNSNSYSLAAQVYAAGGEAVILPVARDDAERAGAPAAQRAGGRPAVPDRRRFDGKVRPGGRGAGLAGRGVLLHRAAIQPGKPVVFGQVALDGKTTPFFGLPGNPVSTMVTFQLFVRPVLDALAGAKPEPLPFAQAILKDRLTTKTGLTRFLPGKLSWNAREARGRTGSLARVGRLDGGVKSRTATLWYLLTGRSSRRAKR